MTKEENNDRALAWVKVLVPVVVILLGGQTYTHLTTPEQIEVSTGKHVDKMLVANLDKKLDSVAVTIASKEYAKSSLEKATAQIKQMNGEQARNYLTKVFAVADEAIKNDSIWRHVQRPWIIREMGKRYLCPYEDASTGLTIMQGKGGNFPVRTGKPAEMQTEGKRLENDINFYYDLENHLTPLNSLKRPLFRRVH